MLESLIDSLPLMSYWSSTPTVGVINSRGNMGEIATPSVGNGLSFSCTQRYKTFNTFSCSVFVCLKCLILCRARVESHPVIRESPWITLWTNKHGADMERLQCFHNPCLASLKIAWQFSNDIYIILI